MSIRAALGASRWYVVRQLFTESIVLALIGGGFGVLAGKWLLDGLILGLGTAPITGTLLQSMRYKTPARDPLVFVAISVLLAATAVLACLLPARGATKVDPIVALRAE
jgi:ABC-type antimicrobial peptide transport system permease subunit